MNDHGRFITPLEVTPLPDGVFWRVVHDLKFVDRRGDLHVVHAGFLTDFASIPPLAFISACLLSVILPLLCVSAWMHWVAALEALGVITGFALFVLFIANSMNDDDRLDGPATLHDNGYNRPRLGKSSWKLKFYWDRLLREALLVTLISPPPEHGGGKFIHALRCLKTDLANAYNLWKAWTIWFNVAAFGWIAWYNDGKKQKKS